MRIMPVDFSIKILLVDDMPAMRSILRGMLEELGFRNVTEAEDGDLAWRLLQNTMGREKKEFGLVIADWQMPGMSGVDLLRAVRFSPHSRELPFFMVTSRGDEAHVREARQAGVTDYLVKPFTSEHLAEKIRPLFTV